MKVTSWLKSHFLKNFMDDAQPIPWTHPRDITIKIPSTNKVEPNFGVTLRVEPEKRIEFGKILEDYLNFCYQAQAVIRIKDEIIDLTSKEPCSITFEINGERNTFGMELQRIGGSLLHCSTKIR